MKICALDLFCGAGGLTTGLEFAGISVTAAIDVDPACRAPIIENHTETEFVCADIKDVSKSMLLSLYPSDADIRVLCACSPCQPFSKYTVREGRDDRWKLISTAVDVIKDTRPDLVVMENVPELAIRHERRLNLLISRIESYGYSVRTEIVDCRDYAIPQSRSRLVVLASRIGEAPALSPPKIRRVRTVRDAIAKLPKIGAGAVAQGKDRLHISPALSELNTSRIRATPEGGSWQDWPKRLRLACHQRSTGKYYGSVYGRMAWDEPAPTITTQCFGYGNGRFGHPDQDRAISLREAALIQTFPRSYRFVSRAERVTFKHVGRLIGNAVPAELGRYIGLALKQAVSESHAEPRMHRSAR